MFIVCLALVAGSLIAGPSQLQTLSPRRLVETVDLGNPVISPDGRQVAFRAEYPSIERNTYDTVWYVQNISEGSLPLRVGEGGVPLRTYYSGVVGPESAAWSQDGRWLYYRAHLDGRVSVWRAATDGSGAHPVTSDRSDVRDFVLDGNGENLLYRTGAARDEIRALEQSQYDRGVRIDESILLSAGLLRSSIVEGFRSSPRFQGEWYLTGSLLSSAPDQWKIVDLADMSTRDLPPSQVPKPPPSVQDLSSQLNEPSTFAFNPADGRVAVAVRRAGAVRDARNSSELMMLSDLDSMAPVSCDFEGCIGVTITDLKWRPGTDEVLFTRADRDLGRAYSVHAWNVATGEVRRVTSSTGMLDGSRMPQAVPCSVSNSFMVCVGAGADRPPHIEAIELSNGRRLTLFRPNQALEADIAAKAPAELIRWSDEQGREFTGYLFKAQSATDGEPGPLFVNFYTCHGFLRGGMGDEWPLVSLAEVGISSLCVDGLPGYSDFVSRYDQVRQAVVNRPGFSGGSNS